MIAAKNFAHDTTAELSWLGPLARHVKLRVIHAPGMLGTFSPPQRVSDPDMHYASCMMQVPWCMPGSLPSSFLWSRWRGKRPRHSHECATHNFMYLLRGPCAKFIVISVAVWYKKSISIIETVILINYRYIDFLASYFSDRSRGTSGGR